MIEHLIGDCREVLPTINARSVHCCITSPPYWRQRSYLPIDHPAKKHEIGSEPSIQAYVDNLVAIFRHVARLLLDEGTLWLNLGDKHADEHWPKAHIKPGDLVGLPWRVALALQADGWILRSDIIWHKPNPKPESVTNRPTKAHEYLFLLAKHERYYYDIDALREPPTSTGGASFGKQRLSTKGTGAQSRRLDSPAGRCHPLGKNKRSVWTVPVRSFPGAHFAVFPRELIRPAILAGCPKGGTVLDPFAGSGTTGHVAADLERNAVLVELNPVYQEMQRHRDSVRTTMDGSQPDKPDKRLGWLF